MKRIGYIALLLFCCSACKLSTPVMKLLIKASYKNLPVSTIVEDYANRIGVPYVENGEPEQVLDVFYANPENRKDAVVIDIHGGFYIAGKREFNRIFAEVFLKEGFDVVLVEYRLNDRVRDVSDELRDCAVALDYLSVHAEELGLNKDRMFLTGDSAGGHLALYMAEGAGNPSMPVRPEVFKPLGVLINCPAYDFGQYGEADGYTEDFKAWFVGPRYKDKEYLASLSPRTFVGSYAGPLFLSTCTNDFIRTESLKLKADCDALGREIVFVDIASEDKKVGHVHNVTDPNLPESREVNAAMIAFMDDTICSSPLSAGLP